MDIQEVERELIGKLILNPNLLLDINVKVEDFFDNNCKFYYAVILDLFFNQRKNVDLLTVTDVIRRSSRNYTGVELAEILSKTFTTAGVRSNVEVILDQSKKRKIQKEIDKIASSLNYNDAITVMKDLENMVMKLQDNSNTSIENKTIADLADELRIKIEDNEKSGKVGIPTGFNKLDECVVGYTPGALWTIGGTTSVGKSTFLTELIIRAMRNKARGIIFSLEDSKITKTAKLICNLMNIGYIRLIHGNLGNLKQSYDIAEAKVKNYPIWIYDKSFYLNDIYLKTKKAVLQGEVDFIAVDYIQNIIVDSVKDIYNQLRHIVSFLYNMSKTFNICVIMLSQVSQQGFMKGAGEITAQSDTVIRLTREQGSPSMKVEVEKNRLFGRTAVGDKAIQMNFTDSWSGIDEI